MSISRRSLLTLIPLPLLAGCASLPNPSVAKTTASTSSALDFLGLDPLVESLNLAPLTDDILASMDHEASSVSELVAACAHHLHYAATSSNSSTPQLLTLPTGGYGNSIFLTKATFPEIAFFDVASLKESTTFNLPPAVTVAGNQEKAEIVTRDFISPDGSITVTAQQLVFHLIAPTAKVLGVES